MAIDRDPLAIFHQPPPDETASQRSMRVWREAEEKRVSDRIDEEIKLQKAALKKRQKNLVKVLLLGQSESGKSTTLKNFRLKYARAAWKQERLSWRSVIQLNLVRSVLIILDAIQAEAHGDPISITEDENTFSLPQPPPRALSIDSTISVLDLRGGPRTSQDSTLNLTDKHRLLWRRLGPLRRLEEVLKCQLGAGTEEASRTDGKYGVLGQRLLDDRRYHGEFGVRAWNLAFDGKRYKDTRNISRSKGDIGDCGSEEAAVVLSKCKQDIITLWKDDVVMEVLKKRKIDLENSAGFFLDDVDRIARLNYEPSDEDIIRCRLRTMGLQEYQIDFDPATGAAGFLQNVGLSQEFATTWVIYDVGGSRTQRQAWTPFFDDVQAIIFLAPISCFDERLLEDPNVNRLEDTFHLWKAVCASRLLAKTTIILFMNKCDLLKRKLRTGVQVKDYLPSYGNRPNEANSVVKYLKDKFKDVIRSKSPEPGRPSFFYATSVTDTKATAATLEIVRDSILRQHLKQADLIS